MKRLLVLAAILVAASLQARTVKLTEWQFSYDGASWEGVTVPHSCNAVDGRSPSYYRGEVHYRRSIKLSSDGPAFLLFEGAAQAAKVYVNGSLATVHRGGYTPFVVPLKGLAHKGLNEVEVICDNHMDPYLIPVYSDFNKNNGLHNPVSLLEYGEVFFSPLSYGPYRVHLTQNTVSDTEARALVEAELCNASSKARRQKVVLTLRDARGKAVWTKKKRVELPAEGSLRLSEDLVLKDPHLWNGLVDPYLYTIEVKAGKDKAAAQIGFRYFSIDRDKGFSLNGKPYSLRGVSMHQDTEGKASALSYEDIDRDYGFVRELGCNFLRLAHYPHNDYAFSLCDRLGIIVQTEIPWVNVCGERATTEYFENIHSQMKEMIVSLYNHPSIVFWGMWNELDDWGNKEEFQGKFDARRVVDETARLYDYAKTLDHTRYVGLTDDSVFKREHYTELKADYYSENRYFGWYYNRGDFSKLTPTMQWIHDTMGVTNLSEYGVGCNPYCHTWNEEDIRRYKDDMRHPEVYANRSHQSHVQQIQQMPWLNFTSLWILFDFPVADRKEGFLDSDDGVNYVENPARLYTNDKGLVTRDRKTKKDAFYLYKAWWNHSEETVYISGRRLRKRPAGQVFDLVAYSNASSLRLYRDGVEVASADSSGEVSGVIWTFKGLEMGSSATAFELVSSSGVRDRVVFEVL